MLRATLPADVELLSTRAQARETFAMTDAFTTNLQAMSLLALLVGTFLIYGAVSFAVLQRRSIMAVLRALGATRAEVLGVILTEGALLGVTRGRLRPAARRADRSRAWWDWCRTPSTTCTSSWR